ncbi:hypothetical protein FRC12_016157 [Ceratobasidium sp. 428]|nr:hypothetical protein FRC12_016157 [Ceratobasidium sp. 428]
MPASTRGGKPTTGAGGGTNKNNGDPRGGRSRNNTFQRSNDVSQLKRQITRLIRRLSISPSEANDLITASGSALNVPIDLLAGQDDTSPNGGNATTAANAVLTVQQADQLKAAVKDAISKAIEMMATGTVTPTAGAIATQVNQANPDLAISRNQEMTASFSSGLATFISKPIGQPAGTAAPVSTRTKTGATATATPTRGNGGNRNGQNRNGQNRNGQNNNGQNRSGQNNNQSGQNGASRNGNANSRAQDSPNATGNKRSNIRRPRVRSRIMRDIALEELV